MDRRSFVIKRIGQSLLVIALAYTLVFFTLFVLPGDPIESRITSPLNPLPQEAIGPLLAYYNFDRGAIEQFVIAVGRLFSGDLGYSLVNGNSVASLLQQAIGETVVLSLTALAFTAVIVLTVALTAVFAPSRHLRAAARALPVVFLSTPSFLVGFLLLQVFAFQLGWVSSIRDQGLISYILPAATLSIAVSGTITQVLIQGLYRASREPFVMVLRAKGVPQASIVARHILPNGSIPTLTLFALTVGELLAGAVVVETVFSRTGIGFLTQQAVRDQDTPVILAVVVLISTVFVVINLVTDLLYPVIDPRIGSALFSPEHAPRRGLSLTRRKVAVIAK
ncbi:ABC transporter permease [Homoserinimonas hongtaonis]|uniref:ABC transporter permease n=1 Tax=Homoserinimonas hongtaonis TaxID=2079791 RepID=UPI000D39362B|nr:ABC transporter permease [Salinibacterium hongtaonis]AWB90166.1 ABC transporter permease [Salinibacterium hongtaonis]